VNILGDADDGVMQQPIDRLDSVKEVVDRHVCRGRLCSDRGGDAGETQEQEDPETGGRGMKGE
jgi:hypothetical protein